MADVIVGIDLGTSNCVVAHRDPGAEVRVLADEAGYKIHPSVVSFLPNGTVAVGAEAKQRKVIDPENTIYSAKRLIGRSFRSPEVQQAKARMPYQIREGANQLPLVVTRAGEFAIPEISAVLLDHVRNIAARALDTEVTQAVITVPANFNDAQRTATATAGAIAGITVVRVLNEPTAAALAHGHARQLHQTIAVYDFGGGTFDVTLLRLEDQVYEVLGTAGDSFLGGDDLDERLVDKMVERFLAEQRIDLRSNEVAMMRLRAVAEQTKIELSRRTRAVVRIDEIAYGAKGVPLNLQIEITREEFVGLVGDIVQRTFPVCQEALRLAGLSVDRIDDIVLVGGTTKVPMVRDQVTKFFGRAPRVDVNPEEAVAIGAALQADSLQELLSRPVQRPSSRAFVDNEQTYDPREATDVAVDVSAAAASGRAKRETADLASRPRVFSERPMTRGMAVDRFEDKAEPGVPIGRVEGRPGSQSTTQARPPSETRPVPSGLPDPRPLTATRPSMMPADEEESTAARPPIDVNEEVTSSGAPVPVTHESTNSSANPLATGRRPAPPAAAAQRPSAPGLPPLPPGASTPPPLPPSASTPPPLPPGARPSAPTLAAAMPPPVPSAARPSAETLAAVAVAGPTSGTMTAEAPPARPSAPGMTGPTPRVSRPRMRDSLPAIDPAPRGLEGGAGESMSSASTARGMVLPVDPQVTARGLVPELPSSLAGAPLPPPPATTARGVAPPMPTMMFGTGLASAPPPETLPLPPPRAPAPPPPPDLLFDLPLPPPPSAPAREMMAQPAPTMPPPGLGPIPGLDAPPPHDALPLPRAGLRTPLPFAAASPPADAFAMASPPADPFAGPGLFAGPDPFAGPGPFAGPDPFAGPLTGPGAPTMMAGQPPPVPGPAAYQGAPLGPPLTGPGAPTMMPGMMPGGFPMPAPAAGAPYVPGPRAPSPVVVDVTPVGLGIVTVAGYCEELIRRNSRVPTEVRKLFSTSRDGQDVVRIIVHQGESRRIEGNVLIGELVLSELPRKPRGELSIEVSFAIDASGILHVRARDAVSGREQRASLNIIGNLPEGEIAASRDRMQSLRR